MSLLLDALKKAEKAKQEAQQRARDKGDEPTEPSLTGEPGRVRTRDELPNISQSLEISSEDLAPKGPAPEPAQPPAAGTGLALELEPAAPRPAAARPAPPPPGGAARAAPPPPPSGSAGTAASDSRAAAGRAAAQKVFEAKFREPNPRLPFYIALGVLGVFAIGTVGYFWYQLRPPAALVNPNPHRPSGEVAVAAPAPTAPGTASAGGPVAPQAIAGLPGAAPNPTPPAAAASSPQPAATPLTPVAPAAAKPTPAPPVAAKPIPPAASPTPAPAQRAEPAPRPAPATGRAVTREIPAPRLRLRHHAPRVNPQVAAAYQAYQSGDLAAARSDYQRALEQEPMNRDALLGLAAVEMRSGRYGLAEGYYQRLLQADPRDPNAQAGLLALRSQLVDPVAAESRVKSLLASDPQADVLYFTLGNEYAQQQRWGEAQQAYLRALAADPDNPDFAYNVAVSCDHLGEHARALHYYHRALALAAERSASFDRAAAQTRVTQLSR